MSAKRVFDIECPYCGEGQDICHDDGFGYGEDLRHEMQCGECNKNFVFRTFVSLSYSPEKADCLNGVGHNIKDVVYAPKDENLVWVRCQDCDYERHYMKPKVDAEVAR